MNSKQWGALPAQVLILAAVFCSLVWKEKNAAAEGQGYTLKRCVDIALERNAEILKAREEIGRQTGVLVEVRSRLLPQFGANASYSKRDENRVPSFSGGTFGSDQTWSADVEVRQSVYAGGGDKAAFDRAQLLEQSAREQMQAVVNNVLLAVREKFYAVLLAVSDLEVQEQNVGLFEEELRFERNKLAAGTVSDFNVLRAEVSLANSQTPYIRAKNALPLAVEDLRRVIGLPAEEIEGGVEAFKVDGTLVFHDRSLELDAAIKEAEQHRPELKVLALAVEAEQKGVRAAFAGYLPKLDVFADYGADKSPFSDDFNDEDHGWQVGAELRVNIFDSFATAGRVQQAEAAASSARINRRQAQLDVDAEVRAAFSSFTESKALVAASSKVVDQAQESVRLARARADVGAATQLDVLQSQVALTLARTNNVQALHAYNVASARMARAMGSSSVFGE